MNSSFFTSPLHRYLLPAEFPFFFFFLILFVCTVSTNSFCLSSRRTFPMRIHAPFARSHPSTCDAKQGPKSVFSLYHNFCAYVIQSQARLRSPSIRWLSLYVLVWWFLVLECSVSITPLRQTFKWCLLWFFFSCWHLNLPLIPFFSKPSFFVV